MRRSSHVFIGLCIATLAVAISFYCAPPPNEPTVNPPQTARSVVENDEKDRYSNPLRIPIMPPISEKSDEKLIVRELTEFAPNNDDKINPNDPAFQHIRQQLKHDISIPKDKDTEDLEVLRASGLGRKEPVKLDPRKIRGSVEGFGSASFPVADLNIPIRDVPTETLLPLIPLIPSIPGTPEPDKVPIKLPDMPELIGGIKLPDIPATLPENVVPKMITNQKLHKLNLAIDQVGKSGITSTEIHVKWKEWSVIDNSFEERLWDRFSQTPKEIDICLDGDGLYIIQPVFVSGSGKVTDKQLGESLSLILDTIKPEVKILSVEVIDSKSSILLNSIVKDKNLDPKSIVVEYTEDGKTWKPLGKISDDEKASDIKFKKEISLPKDLKTHIFVRMIARDLAGNETIEYYPKRLAVDLVVPKGRLMLPVDEKGWWGTLPVIDPVILSNWWNWGSK